MNRLRLWLAFVWLIFASLAPAHAAVMSHNACDRMPQNMTHMNMVMPHAPAQTAPVHDEGAMPCCSVPVIILAEPFVPLSERAIVFVKLRPLPVRQLDGRIPTADPRPPKTSEI